MIKKVLERICAGWTLAEISQNLNMEYSALISMLEHLVKLGYLTKGTKTDTGTCKTCPLREHCSERNYTIYFLTDKGRKIAGSCEPLRTDISS